MKKRNKVYLVWNKLVKKRKPFICGDTLVVFSENILSIKEETKHKENLDVKLSFCLPPNWDKN